MFQVEKSLNASTGVGSYGHHPADVQEVTEDCINYLATMESGQFEDVGGDEAAAAELRKLLSRNWVEGLMYAHDKIRSGGGGSGRVSKPLSPMDDSILERLSHYGEANVKIVRIDKSSTEPLGATVKNDQDAVIVGRIIRGGTAEASGLLHEGDEVRAISSGNHFWGKLNHACLQNAV